MKKISKSPWTIGIATTLLSFALTVLYDLIKGQQVLSTITSFLFTVRNAILFILNFNIKFWWLLVVFGVFIVLLYILCKFYNNKNSSTAAWLQYQKDTIMGWEWEWKWNKDYYGKYYVDDLHPVCSHCGTPVVRSHDYSDNLICVRCNRKFRDELPHLDHVKTIIYDNARRNLIPNSED